MSSMPFLPVKTDNFDWEPSDPGVDNLAVRHAANGRGQMLSSHPEFRPIMPGHRALTEPAPASRAQSCLSAPVLPA